MKKTVSILFTLTLLLAMVSLGFTSVQATEYSPEKSFASSVALDGIGNDGISNIVMPGGFAGMKVTIGSTDILVTSVGRWNAPGSAINHGMLIANMDGSLVLNYTTVTATNADINNFAYAALSEPVTLIAGHSYYIVSDFQGASDVFYASSVQTCTTDATLDGIVILGQNWDFYAAPNIGWGPVDFKYKTETAVSESSSSETSSEISNSEISSSETSSETSSESSSISSSETSSISSSTSAPTATPSINPTDLLKNRVKKNFTTAVTLNGLRNNLTDTNAVEAGWGGMRVTIGNKPVLVTSIGRLYAANSVKTRNMLLIDVETGDILASAKINVPDNAVPGTFIYGELSKVLTLQPGKSYDIIFDFWGKTDEWYDAAVQTHTNVATIDGITVMNLETNKLDFFAAPDTGWGPVDFIYYEEGNPQTNDQINVMPYIAILASLLMFISFYIFKQKNNLKHTETLEK